MSNPEFTVVIPVHNGANYIESALKSVLAQSYPPVRILILENASTDNTVDIIRSLRIPYITIVPSESLLPIEQNWGRIVQQDLNGYITFMGHDDLLYPDFLQEAAALIAAEPRASLYQVQFEEIDTEAHPGRRPPMIAYRETPDQFLAAVMNEREEACGTGYVMHADDYRRVGGIPPFPGLLYADVALWYRLTALSYKVCSPKTLVGYRIHPHNMHRDSNLIQYYLAIKHYRVFFQSIDGLKPTVIDNYINKFLQSAYRHAAAGVAHSGQGYPALQQAKQHIAQERLFRLDDRLGRIYEVIASLPPILRGMALWGLKRLKVMRQWISSRMQK